MSDPDIKITESSSFWSTTPDDNFEERIIDINGLIQVKANVLRSQTPVNWYPYLQAGLISRDDYSFITNLQDAKTKEHRDTVIQSSKEGSINILLTVAHRVCIVEELQKFLVIIDDMLTEDMSRVDLFNPNKTEPWRAFLDLLSCNDDFVRNISSQIICKFICVEGCTPKPSDTKIFLNWLKNELRVENHYLLSVARCLQAILKIDVYRVSFGQINGIFRIIRILTAGVKPQAQYQLVYCLWISSFNSEVAENLNNFSIIPVLYTLLEASRPEIIKLPRIVMATFRNLLEKPREEGVRRHNALVMIQCGLFKYLEVMENKLTKLKDLEFVEDVHVIDELLRAYVTELSSFDEYRIEVISQHLEWSVVHTSKTFWDENWDRLNENHFELLKILVMLLDTSNDSTALCVAAHDLGEYMSRYPRGKKVVEELGCKDILLRLLSSKDSVVKYHALKCLQILMLNSYNILTEYVSTNITSDSAIKNWNRQNMSRM